MFSPSTGKCTSLLESDIVIATCKGNAEFPLKDIAKYKDTTVLDIGTYNGKRLVCLNLPDLEGGVPLRAFFTEAEPEIAHIAILAAHLSWWKALYKHCPKCGKPLKEHYSERCMTCDACEENFYPVISPAIIVLITKENRILLAHNTKFPPKRHSLLAGFVEPGESLETAVHREVMEETGIRIKNLRYLESQPWPFPNSLMAAFAAEWESGELKPDGVEIEGAAWYASSDELPDLPPKGGVARKLIDNWIEERRKAIFAE
jgi:NAD+ diphosphatase